MYMILTKTTPFYNIISLNNKILIYKQIIQPSMTNGIQFWGTTKKSNLNQLFNLQPSNY